MPDPHTTNYLEYYRRLGIQPGATWKHARNAYKQKIRQWHPDRFAGEGTAHFNAEEQSKLINQAYQELLSFYEQSGRLPLDKINSESEASELHVNGQSSTINTHPNNPSTAPRPTYSGWTHESSIKPAQRNLLTLVIMSILLLIVVNTFIKQPDTDDQSETYQSLNSLQSPMASAQVRNETAPINLQEGSQDQHKIHIGSTIGEVYSIQGVPTLVEGDTWYYGTAQIHFVNGRVSAWWDTFPPTLKIGSGNQKENPRNIFHQGFRLGSNKDEVRLLQGQPLRETEREWNYGLSRIFFDREGNVTGWHESPLSPLRVNRE